MNIEYFKKVHTNLKLEVLFSALENQNKCLKFTQIIKIFLCL